MIELLKAIWQTIKALAFDWFPRIEEMILAAKGILSEPKKLAGSIVAVIAATATIIRFLRKHDIDTW